MVFRATSCTNRVYRSTISRETRMTEEEIWGSGGREGFYRRLYKIPPNAPYQKGWEWVWENWLDRLNHV